MFFLILACLWTSSVKADPRWIWLKQIHDQHRPSLESISNQLWFNQKVDHFDPTNRRVFRQRFFVDSSLVKGNKSVAPVLFYLCGESSCEGANGSDLVNQLALKLGAHRVSLEHRYYGRSQPFKTLESQNLRYLSMEQAIEDLADFQSFAQEQLQLQGRWISIGGSYPGALSAFYRMKHPEKVMGALASSAPVLALESFEEYDRHVARVAGSECSALILKAVREVELRLKNENEWLTLKKKFRSERIVDNIDFLYVLADMAATAIQYGRHQIFCDQLRQGERSGRLVDAYAEAGNRLLSGFGISALQISFQGAESTNPEEYLGWAGLRSWMYQSCTQFGFFQVANSNPALSARSPMISLSYHQDVCKRLFGIQKPVETMRTNREFYWNLFDPSVSKIHFTNGSNDPWSELSITESSSEVKSNRGLTFFSIPGSAHCEDLGGVFSGPLNQARTQIETLFKKWLSE